MDFAALQLPKLNLGAAVPASRAQFLAPIDPPTFPFTPPSWVLAQHPRSISLLDVYKSHEQLATYTVDQKATYLIGRNMGVCDIVLNHCSVSRLHAALLHHQDGSTYLVDLGSCHGSSVNDVPLRALQPTLLVHGAVVKFGASSRSYSFRSFESHDEIVEMVQSRIGLTPDEQELQQNTLLNRGLSYRLGFSIPLTHKARAFPTATTTGQEGMELVKDAEGDDPMVPARQMEESTSAAALIRRTQSEDNTMTTGAVAFPLPTQLHHPHGVDQDEPGRKRSRTQSAGPLTTAATASNPHGLPATTVATTGADGDDVYSVQSPLRERDEENEAMSRHVHFCEKAPTIIPASPMSQIADESEDACEPVSMTSSSTSSSSCSTSTSTTTTCSTAAAAVTSTSSSSSTSSSLTLTLSLIREDCGAVDAVAGPGSAPTTPAANVCA